jgi:hypothetical protein
VGSPLAKYSDRSANTMAVAVVLQGNSAVSLSVSAVAAQTAPLDGGIYDVWCDVDTYIKVATTANDVTADNGYLLRANNTIPLLIGDTDKIGAISGGSGTLKYHRVN